MVQLPDTARDGQLSLEPGHLLYLYDKVAEFDSVDVDKDSPFSEVEKTLGLTVSICSSGSGSGSCSWSTVVAAVVLVAVIVVLVVVVSTVVIVAVTIVTEIVLLR